MVDQLPPPTRDSWAPPRPASGLPLSADATLPSSATDGATAAAPSAGPSGAPTRWRPPKTSVMMLLACIFAVSSGAFALLAIDSWVPRRAESGVVTRADIEQRRVRSNGRTRTVTDHIVAGRTDGGDDWRIVSEDVYDIVLVGTRVDLEFSRLSGRVVAVTSPFGGYDQRSLPISIVMGAVPVAGAITYLVMWLRSRRRARWARSRHVVVLGCVAIGVIVSANFL